MSDIHSFISTMRDVYMLITVIWVLISYRKSVFTQLMHPLYLDT